MAQWQFTLDLKDVWKKPGITPLETAAVISKRINLLLPKIRKRKHELYQDMADELENDVLPMFDELIEMENDDVDDFDWAMEALYDWADSPLDNEWGCKKMCWVATVI